MGWVYISNPATPLYTPPPSSLPISVFSPFLLGAGHYLFYLHSFIRAELILLSLNFVDILLYYSFISSITRLSI